MLILTKLDSSPLPQINKGPFFLPRSLAGTPICYCFYKNKIIKKRKSPLERTTSLTYSSENSGRSFDLASFGITASCPLQGSTFTLVRPRESANCNNQNVFVRKFDNEIYGKIMTVGSNSHIGHLPLLHLLLTLTILHIFSFDSVLSAICDFSLTDDDKLYNYNLASPSPNFPHGVLSEDGYLLPPLSLSLYIYISCFRYLFVGILFVQSMCFHLL